MSLSFRISCLLLVSSFWLSGPVPALSAERAILHSVAVRLEQFPQPIAPPEWQNGLLIIRSIQPDPDQPHVTILRRDGTVVSRIRVPWIEAHDDIHVFDATVSGTNGAAIVSASFVGGATHVFALCFFDSAAKLTRLVRTNPFSAHRVRVAADGSVWAFGVNGEGEDNPKTEVFWRFSAEGDLHGRYLPRSEFHTFHQMHPANVTLFGRPFLLASRDRISAYSPDAQEWIEFGLDGTLRGRHVVPSPSIPKSEIQEHGPDRLMMAQVAMTESNRVFASLTGGTGSGLYELDRTRFQWVPLTAEQTAGLEKSVGGSEGDLLIVGIPSREGRAYGWVRME